MGKDCISLTGKIREKRSTGLPCKCKMACFTKISDGDKHEILETFNQIACKEKQDTYICGLIQMKEIVRKRPRTGKKNTKTFTSKFIVRIGINEFNVCKRAFCSLHGISFSRVDRLQVCVKSNNPSPRDSRGKHINRPNIISETIINQINEHIKSFPKRQSHYSRESNRNVTYLSPELNLKIMHSLYLEKYETDIYKKLQDGEKVNPTVKYDFFTRHFADNFNISFGFPRTDTCQTCDNLKNVIDAEIDMEQKIKLQTEKDLHVAKAELFYKDLKKYDTDAKILINNIEILCFDFQQNLPLPHVPAGDVFYKRQLWVYNFCVYSGRTGKSYFYMYDEVTAKKGKNEVISFLNHFLGTILDRQVDTVYLFSDNCSSQNKNHCLTQFLYTIAKTQMYGIKKIIHRYPEPGHSFLPCDRSFGQIEKQRRRQERVFLPQTYQNIVKCTSRKFIVINVTQELILNFSDHMSSMFKTQKQLQLMIYRIMIYSHDGLRVSISPNASDGQLILLEKPRTLLTIPGPTFRLYNKILPLKSAKYKDVQELVSKYVPPDCLSFYSKLTTTNY